MSLADCGGPGPFLADSLRSWAKDAPGDLAVVILDQAGRESERLNAAELDRAARRVAGGLRRRGQAGRPVLLLARSDLAFVQAFCGCLYSGAIAVPVPPPAGGARLARLQAIAADCGAVLGLGEIAPSLSGAIRVEWSTLADLTDGGDEAAATAEHATALLQYTSGSTGDPRGVVLSHGNVAANVRMVRAAFGIRPDSRFLSWLPLFHDMGLMALMLSLTARIPLALMAPASFLHRPLGWLQAIWHWNATISGGPNFAYDACRRAIGRTPDMPLDLGRWRTAFCGAEPVRRETLDGFVEGFRGFGFRRESLFPCYGLAEATVLVAGRYLDEESSSAQSTVACGGPAGSTRIRIVDPATRERVRDGATGEIWVAGPQIGQGYWGRPEASEASFVTEPRLGPGRWLRTGDLGALTGAGLSIRGRLKDLIIHRGANLDPADVEASLASCHLAVGAAGAAFSLDGPDGDVVVACCEVGRGMPPPDPDQVTEAALAAVAAAHGIRLHDLVLLRHGSLPRTTSGKIMRGKVRARYAAGTLHRLVANETHISLGRNTSR